jgi:hypothetical protein
VPGRLQKSRLTSRDENRTFVAELDGYMTISCQKALVIASAPDVDAGQCQLLRREYHPDYTKCRVDCCDGLMPASHALD